MSINLDMYHFFVSLCFKRRNMLPIEPTLPFSDHSSLYDILVPKTNLLRQINDLIEVHWPFLLPISSELSNYHKTEEDCLLFISIQAITGRLSSRIGRLKTILKKIKKVRWMYNIHPTDFLVFSFDREAS